jgi:effector-binding domain-containing protein
MKRISLILAVVLLLLLAFTYLFIPNRITVSENITIAANPEAIFRKLGDTTEWQKWWPGEKKDLAAKHSFTLNGFRYSLDDKKILSLPISISNQIFKALTELTFIPENTDESTLSLNGVIPTSYNPIRRIQLFFTANKIKKDITTLLQSIKSYYSTTSSLYGYDIQKKQVVDSTLLSTSKEIKGYPSTETVYSLIDELKNYIKQQAANETGYPMRNIFTKDSITYLVKVAIPVDKKLPSSGNIVYRWMLGGGNILITEVKGGEGEIQKAYNQIQNYISDNKRVAPAIPFESLVTDRRQEADSSKWITRIYYPVM